MVVGMASLNELMGKYRAYLEVLKKYFGDYRYVKKYMMFYEGALTALEVVKNARRRGE